MGGTVGGVGGAGAVALSWTCVRVAGNGEVGGSSPCSMIVSMVV